MTAVRKLQKPKVFYPHQREAYAYTLHEKHPALFMEMRLGKTLVAIRRFKSYGSGRVCLVVAPNSALPSWEKEARAEGCSVENFSGIDTNKINQKIYRLFSLSSLDRVGLSSYFVLFNKEGWMRKGLVELDSFPWTSVILDESTFIKSPKTKTTKYFLSRFRNVPHRWIMTGTPWPESEDEIYCQLKFLGHNLLGAKSYWEFRNSHMTQYPYGGWGMKTKSKEKVYKDVGSRALVMRRKDVSMAENKVHETRTFSFPENIRKIYDKVEEEFVLETSDDIRIETVWVTTKYQWLRQLCGGHAQHSLIWDAKIRELHALMDGELHNERVVVWCNYNDEVSSIVKYFKRKKIGIWSITGKTPVDERWKIVSAWEKCHAGLLVMQQKCGQMGLDLSASDTAIYYSTPVPAVERLQTEDRVVSMKKIKKGNPILIIDFVVEGSVDVDIQKLLEKKEVRSDLSASRSLVYYMRSRKGI